MHTYIHTHALTDTIVLVFRIPEKFGPGQVLLQLFEPIFVVS